MSHAYAAFKLDEDTREILFERFSPRYSDVKMDHITIQYPCNDESTLFTPDTIEVIGHVDDGEGIEALLVKVDGQIFKPDGSPWHITLSLDKSKNAPLELDPYETAPFQGEDKRQSRPYAPAMSNNLIRYTLNPEVEGYSVQYLDTPIQIEATPKIIGSEPKHPHYELSGRCPE